MMDQDLSRAAMFTEDEVRRVFECARKHDVCPILILEPLSVGLLMSHLCTLYQPRLSDNDLTTNILPRMYDSCDQTHDGTRLYNPYSVLTEIGTI